MGKDESVVVWRTVWDRELDADQFLEVIDPLFEGTAAKRGRVVDLSWSTSSGLEAAAAGALEKHPFSGDSSRADAATTAGEEAAWKARQRKRPRVESKRWMHEELGFTLPVPDGFGEKEINGNPVLVGEVAEEFGDNITALDLPNALGDDLEKHIALNRTQLGQLGLKVDAIERVTIGGHRVLLLEYHGRLSKHTNVLHFLCMIKLTETRQLIVTATVLEKRWTGPGEGIRKAFEGMEFSR
jgi:hypothetical protein